jgi:twitching motility protein PilT
MMQNKGSDLHIAVGSPPMIRIRGDLAKLNLPPLTASDMDAMLKQCTPADLLASFAKEKSVDFAFKASGVGVFRVNAFFQRHGISMVLRALTETPPTMQDLNLPEICKTACSFANGLVLVTGPTGSGKSTTLAAMINHINSTTPGHILTLEDPIEFQHDSKMGMMSQRSLGPHFPTFSSAMKAALREDPDVILVGEMRDAETVALALKAAETGHLVFSNLHTNSAIKTIDRIINTFPAEEQNQVRTLLAETLKVVISQKLVPASDKKRRICFQDIFVNTPAGANLIREGKCFQLQTVMQTGKKDGMQILDQALLEAVKRGDVKGEDAWEFANDKALFQQWAPKGSGDSSGAGAAASTSPPSPQAGSQVTNPALKKAG